MHNINFIISVPRSGQNLIKDSLNYYLDLLNTKFNYCEHYTCCNSIPCKKNILNTFHKNHDFNICTQNSIKLYKNNKYLFLYRKLLLEQIEAHFRFDKLGYKNSKNKIDYNNKENLQELKNFIFTWKNYYSEIYNKYLSYNDSNILHIEYYDLIYNFFENFKKILYFFEIEINDEFIKLTMLHVKPLNIDKIYKNSTYYDELNKYINYHIKNYFLNK